MNKQLMVFICAIAAGWVYAEEVSSPDGKIVLSSEVVSGKPQWGVRFNDKPLIVPGSLGVETESKAFSGAMTLLKTERTSGDSSWKPVWGDYATIRDQYNEMTLVLKNAEGHVMQLVFRAYNEGVALRYVFPKQSAVGTIKFRKLLTEFRFDNDGVVWQNRNYDYGKGGISKLIKSECNVTIDLGKERWVSLADADRSDFPEVAWERNKDIPYTVSSSLRGFAESTLPFKTAWHVVIIGDKVAKLYENRYIVQNLNPPCAFDTSWIRPGNAVSQVRNCERVTAEIKTLMDWASQHGIDYVEIDHSWNGAETKWTPEEIAKFEQNMEKGWEKRPEWRQNVKGDPRYAVKGWVPFRPHSFKVGGSYVDLNVKEACEYGKSLNPKVGLCVYVRGELLKEFGGEHAIDDVFKCYAEQGLAGVKPGFVPSGSQYNERMINTLIATAAKYKLIMSIHDSYYPSGLDRTFPNLMTVEGGAGDEAEHSVPPELKSVHDVCLPFTRILTGPFDYTPEIGRKSKTHCHQVALLGYPGRATIRGGTKQWAPGGECGVEQEFAVRYGGGLFDDTHVFAEMGKYVTFARRKGKTWFIITIGGFDPVSYTLPLDFLEKGKAYKATIYSDDNRKAKKSEASLVGGSSVKIVTEQNGGHLMILE